MSFQVLQDYLPNVDDKKLHTLSEEVIAFMKTDKTGDKPELATLIPDVDETEIHWLADMYLQDPKFHKKRKFEKQFGSLDGESAIIGAVGNLSYNRANLFQLAEVYGNWVRRALLYCNDHTVSDFKYKRGPWNRPAPLTDKEMDDYRAAYGWNNDIDMTPFTPPPVRDRLAQEKAARECERGYASDQERFYPG